MTDLERMMGVILSLGKKLSETEGILNLPSGKQLEFAAQYLLEQGVILPPCMVGDYVKFTGSDEIWRVDCLHFYREGVPQISITRENVTHTVTPNMFVNCGGRVICHKQEVNTT
jgi:hypothetical protein